MRRNRLPARDIAPAVMLAMWLLLLTSTMSPLVASRIEPNTNRWGGDLYSFVPQSPGAATCEKVCREGNPGLPYPPSACLAFTYVKPTAASPNGKCWIKDEIPLAQDSTCCVSGVVRQNVCVPGHTGRLQKTGVNATVLGDRLDYQLKGLGSWIHYAIPTAQADTVLEGVHIRYTIDPVTDGSLTSIHVYDGKKRIWNVDNQSYGSKLSGKGPQYNDTLFPLGKLVQVREGIGISVLPKSTMTGTPAKPFTIKIHSVCAFLQVVR